jgi:uncharacterized membrane protein (UPF0136 family)
MLASIQFVWICVCPNLVPQRCPVLSLGWGINAMDKLPASVVLALVVTAIYGLVTLVGGFIGYVKANSAASLIAGGILGVLLLLCAAGMLRYPRVSLVSSAILALVLLRRFGWPAFGFAEREARTVDYVMTVGGIAVVLTSILALLLVFRTPSGS